MSALTPLSLAPLHRVKSARLQGGPSLTGEPLAFGTGARVLSPTAPSRPVAIVESWEFSQATVMVATGCTGGGC